MKKVTKILLITIIALFAICIFNTNAVKAEIYDEHVPVIPEDSFIDINIDLSKKEDVKEKINDVLIPLIPTQEELGEIEGEYNTEDYEFYIYSIRFDNSPKFENLRPEEFNSLDLNRKVSCKCLCSILL